MIQMLIFSGVMEAGQQVHQENLLKMDTLERRFVRILNLLTFLPWD